MKVENGELVSIVDETTENGDNSMSEYTDVASPIPSMPSTPLTSTAKKPGRHGRGKVVTGYIIYSSEQRKAMCEENPGSTFGEISRKLGDEWKTMDPKDRAVWEGKAAKLNEAARIKWELDNSKKMNDSVDGSPTTGGTYQPGQPIPNQVRVLFVRWYYGCN